LLATTHPRNYEDIYEFNSNAYDPRVRLVCRASIVIGALGQAEWM